MGINRNGDPAVCMVPGCRKKAIYRNYVSAKRQKTQRGYCAAHKALAVNAEYFERYLDRAEADYRTKLELRKKAKEWS